MLDTSAPSLARAYDYLLGGGASFAADRALGDRMLALYPGLRDILIASRTHAADSVAHSARRGVDQFLDIGAGLPTRPSTHEIARAARPGARVVCVDRDPAVAGHGAMLVPPGVRYLTGDLAEPEALLAALGYRGARTRPPAGAAPVPGAAPIDFSRPVCLVLGLIVQAVEPGTAQAVTGVLVRALPPGSYLVVTAGAGEPGRLPDSVWPREISAADLESFFSGLDLLPPGVQARGGVLCGTGVKAAPTAGPAAGPVGGPAGGAGWRR